MAEAPNGTQDGHCPQMTDSKDRNIVRGHIFVPTGMEQEWLIYLVNVDVVHKLLLIIMQQ